MSKRQRTFEKEPLYRRMNTIARNVHHHFGGEYRWSRHAKRDDVEKLGSMHRRERRGLDYTPLFHFLLSKVGEDWDAVYGEAVSRLDRPDPIFWLVARSQIDRKSFVRLGDSSYYSGLYIDDDNRLALVRPALTEDHIVPSCECCTHTFNGKPLTRKYDYDEHRAFAARWFGNEG